ncbi:hypothetical protein [Xanthobacter autotrophicus]|uniref:hypothetical protein n=1 Tax=Xanthobacter autotrophicus TaxID=280 RepID=UPI00372AC561
MTPDPATLRRLTDLVETRRDALPAIDVNDRASYARHREAALQVFKDLEKEGARWRNDFDFAGARLSLGGVTATSTMGPAMAMANWLVGARRRIRELQAGERA